MDMSRSISVNAQAIIFHRVPYLWRAQVLKCCGVRVHNLAHLAHLLKNAVGPYVRLDLQWNKVCFRSSHTDPHKAIVEGALAVTPPPPSSSSSQ